MGLAKIYDVDPSVNARATNLSARGFVGTGNDVLIGGIIGGGPPRKRATRSQSGARPIARRRWSREPLANPTLSLRDTNENVLANNDNWQDSQQADIAATGMAPPNTKESAILALLAPGNYTVIVTGKNGAIGVGLVEFYSLP